MKLLQMSFAGGIMTLATVLIRAVLLFRLPKKTFLLLWMAVGLRLLLPFSIASPISLYTFLTYDAGESGSIMLPAERRETV